MPRTLFLSRNRAGIEHGGIGVPWLRHGNKGQLPVRCKIGIGVRAGQSPNSRRNSGGSRGKRFATDWGGRLRQPRVPAGQTNLLTGNPPFALIRAAGGGIGPLWRQHVHEYKSA